MILYHASTSVIELPDILHSRDCLDFGRGFYLTIFREQAESMPSVFFVGEMRLTSIYMKFAVIYPVSRKKSLRLIMKSG